MRRGVARAELTLISAMALGFLLILQPWSFGGYRIGLMLVLAATVLNIAVGNLPRDAAPLRALLLAAGLLLILAAVFGIGIALVPLLAQMGQSA